MVSRCMAHTAMGGACSAQPVRNDGYCYWHSPATASEREEARRRGGTNRSNRTRAKKAAAGMDSGEIDQLLGEVLTGVLTGRFSPGAANAAATVAKALIMVREAGAIERIEARLAELES